MCQFKVILWMVYLLLLFCDLSYSCGSAEYNINGECCPMCAPGTHVYRHCTEFTSTACIPCSPRSFTDEPNGLSNCSPCTVCEPVSLGLKTVRECTPTSDTVCGPLDQHYCTKRDDKGCRLAQRHTVCNPGQFIKQNGTASTDTECGDCPDKTFSDQPFAADCKPHTDCQLLGLEEIVAGTNTVDSECGCVTNCTEQKPIAHQREDKIKLTSQLKEEVSQKGLEVARVTAELEKVQKDLEKERADRGQLERQVQANQAIITALQLQLNRTKVSQEQMQTRFERLRLKIIQAAYSAPGAKQPQTEISDAALLQTMQKIIDDRTTFHQRLQQKGEKMPPLTIAESHSVKTASPSAKK